MLDRTGALLVSQEVHTNDPTQCAWENGLRRHGRRGLFSETASAISELLFPEVASAEKGLSALTKQEAGTDMGSSSSAPQDKVESAAAFLEAL